MARSNGRIFDYHVSTPIYHDDEVKQHIPMEKPDRVYGLARTDRMRSLFDSISTPDGSSIANWGKYSPYADRDSLLLPFLVYESKSGWKSANDTAALRQSAFVIRHLLKLQLHFKEQAGGRSRWVTGPVVWFISHIGQQWTVRVAHMSETDSSTKGGPQWVCKSTVG